LSAGTDAPPDLLGREAETERLDALIDGLPTAGGALILRGEAGIGKSALLERSRVQRSSLCDRQVFGQTDDRMQQLVQPSERELGPRFNADRREDSATSGFGAGRGVRGERRTRAGSVPGALAAFQLVCDTADRSPLVLLVDDAQWIDQSTLGALTFIARRLEGEPVALVAAVRAGHSTPLEDAHVPTVDLARLSASAAARFLDQRAPELTRSSERASSARQLAIRWRWSSLRGVPRMPRRITLESRHVQPR
jgi:predicted ATPase